MAFMIACIGTAATGCQSKLQEIEETTAQYQ